MINFEAGGGQDAGLDLAQDVADLVHGLVLGHDRGPCSALQPPMFAICTAQHAVDQLPAQFMLHLSKELTDI